MKLVIFIVTCIFVFESTGLGCVSAPTKKAANKKHETVKQVSHKKSSKSRAPASVSKSAAKKKESSKSKQKKKAQLMPLPKKKFAQSKWQNNHRKVASVTSKAKSKKIVKSRKKQDPLQPMLAYLNQQDESSQASLIDNMDETEVDSQAVEEVESNGIKTVRRDRAKIIAEDPVVNENH
jgi:spore germination protein YaaH